MNIGSEVPLVDLFAPAYGLIDEDESILMEETPSPTPSTFFGGGFFLDEDEMTPMNVHDQYSWGDFVAPAHGLFFKDEETVTEEQFAYTLIGVIISILMVQFKWITKQAVKLILRSCPRLHRLLRQALGLLQIVEEAVQEIDSETLGYDL